MHIQRGRKLRLSDEIIYLKHTKMHQTSDNQTTCALK